MLGEAWLGKRRREERIRLSDGGEGRPATMYRGQKPAREEETCIRGRLIEKVGLSGRANDKYNSDRGSNFSKRWGGLY